MKAIKYQSDFITLTIPVAASVSEFTLNNFSFRKEPMSAPKGQEVCRAHDEVEQQ